MKQLPRRKGIAVMLGLVALFVGACALSMNAFLSDAANADGETVHTAQMPRGAEAPEADLRLIEGLDIKAPTSWAAAKTAISPQYAVAAASEKSSKAFGKPFTGRVLVTLGSNYDQYMYEPLSKEVWGVTGEVDGAMVFGNVDDNTGRVISLNLYTGSMDWSKFDSLTEPTDEQKEEALRQEGEAMQDQGPSLQEQIEQERARNRERHEARYREMQELAESTKDSPLNAKAIELINSLDLADGARAVSSRIVNEYWADSYEAAVDPNPTKCTLEVALDNGTYILMDMGRDSMEMMGYLISETSMFDAYGQVAMG